MQYPATCSGLEPHVRRTIPHGFQPAQRFVGTPEAKHRRSDNDFGIGENQATSVLHGQYRSKVDPLFIPLDASSSNQSMAHGNPTDTFLLVSSNYPIAYRNGVDKPKCGKDANLDKEQATVDTPVALILFNRPEPTARVFDSIRKARPPRLFLIADGPRPDRPDDAALVATARKTTDRVDWPCDVVKLFSDENLGVGKRVASGIDFVFESAPEAIILEDDCLPSDSFFPFCETLLRRYRDNENVMLISGTNNLLTWKAAEQDYHFSAYGSIWGWASWRRAWRQYDFDLNSLSDSTTCERVAGFLSDSDQYEYMYHMCEQVRTGEIDTWDYQWAWDRLANQGLAIVSAKNLVSNLGFGDSATHTVRPNLLSSNLSRFEAPPDLRKPKDSNTDRDYDRRLFQIWQEQPEIDSLIERGVAMIEGHRHIHALILFEEASKLNPEKSELLFYKAKALIGLRRFSQAQTILNKLNEIAPDFVGSHELLSRILVEK